MRKQKLAQTMNSLFDSLETITPPKESPIKTEKKSLDPTACPQCGGRSQVTAWPMDHEGCQRYCPRCPAKDGDGPLYFKIGEQQ